MMSELIWLYLTDNGCLGRNSTGTVVGYESFGMNCCGNVAILAVFGTGKGGAGIVSSGSKSSSSGRITARSCESDITFICLTDSLSGALAFAVRYAAIASAER